MITSRGVWMCQFHVSSRSVPAFFFSFFSDFSWLQGSGPMGTSRIKSPKGHLRDVTLQQGGPGSVPSSPSFRLCPFSLFSPSFPSSPQNVQLVQLKASKSSDVLLTCSPKVTKGRDIWWLTSESHNALTTEHDEVSGYRCSSHLFAFYLQGCPFSPCLHRCRRRPSFSFSPAASAPAHAISSIDTYGCSMFQLKYRSVRTHFQKECKGLAQPAPCIVFAI